MDISASECLRNILIQFYEKRDIAEATANLCQDVKFYGSFSEDTVEGAEAVREILSREIQFFPVAYEIRKMKIREEALSDTVCCVIADYSLGNAVDEEQLIYHMTANCCLEGGAWWIKTIHASFLEKQHKRIMERMQQTLDRYHEAITDTDFSIWYYDMKKKCILQEEQSVNIHGFDHIIENVPESLIASGYVHPDDVQSFREMYGRMFAGEARVTGDFWVRQTDRDAYWCERITYKVVYDDKGEPVMALGASKDVSLEKENERRFREEVELRNTLREKSPGSYVLNLSKNKLMAANERIESLGLGKAATADEFFMRCRQLIVNTTNGIDVNEILDRQKLLKGFREAEKRIQFETKYRNSDRQSFWLLWTLRILKKPQTEELMAFIYLEDITERYILQNIMRNVIEKEYDYAQVIETETKEVFWYHEGKMIRCWISEIWENFVNMEEAAENISIERVMEKLETQDTYEYTCACYGEKKKQCYKQWRFRYISGKRKKIVVVKRDVTVMIENHTRQKTLLESALKRAESASVAKGTFLANMSHEIRTPLNAVIGYLAIAQDREESPEKRQHCLENCDISAKHLLHIINDVLDMSAIESGRLKIANDEFDLKKQINEITAIYYQNAVQKGIHFDAVVNGLTEEWVVGDPLRLNQILMNLLSNAVKFTPDNGTIRLEIRQLNEDDERVYLQFLVSDTGIGMKEDYLQRLFQPFEQATADTARNFGGSGLGLSIAHDLITMMGGTVTVQSEYQKGTSFRVNLHFDKSKDHKMPGIVPKQYSKLRVLVADDKSDEGIYIRDILKRCGVKADFVESGADAIKRIQGRKGGDYEYDLCILDWNMPQMTGIETAEKIRGEFGEKMPVIILTAYDASMLMDAAAAAGVSKILTKPVFQSTMFDLLVSTFGSYHPENETTEQSNQINLGGIRILLAEDNEMNMDIAVTMLEKANINVEQATNGQIAYEKFVSAPECTYSMILMDIQMPVLNGYEATEKIRSSSHPEAKTIPIIAMTANAFAEDVTEALSHGMNAHISKPVNYDKLFRVLDAAIQKQT